MHSSAKVEMAEYRVDELARAAGTTVRNVRVYQDRGLLPPPRKEGRVGIYTDAHLARLRLIGQLLERGYTFAHISEFIAAWEQGKNLPEVLGLEQALSNPWSDEIPGYITAEELLEKFREQTTPHTTERAIELGLIEPEGDRFRVPSPRLLHAGAELVAAGIPLETVLDLAGQLREDVDVVARRLVQTVANHVFAAHDSDWLPSGEEVPELAEFVGRLRPLAQMAVDAVLAQAMEQQVHAVLGDRLAHVIAHLEQGRDKSA